MKIFLFIIVLLLATGQATLGQQTQTSVSRKAKTTASVKVTGYYRLRSKWTPSSIEVLQLPGGKIKFHLLALWVSSYNKDNVHVGEVQGIVELKGDTAVYEADHCQFTIRFTGTAAIVKQAIEPGDCDFGANVTAAGTYRKVHSRKPKFDF